MCPTNELEAIYSCFKAYKTTPEISVSHVSVSENDIQQLLASSLRQISGSDISRYAFKAMTTWGSVQDFKHFLPRLIELHHPRFFLEEGAGDELPATFIIFGKLKLSEFSSWPEVEQKAVTDYLKSVWVSALSLGPSKSAINVILEAISYVGLDIQPYLEEMQSRTNVECLWHLSKFIVEECDFEWSTPEHEEVFREFLLSPDMAKNLEDAFFEFSEHEASSDISNALLYLGR